MFLNGGDALSGLGDAQGEEKLCVFGVLHFSVSK